MAGEVAAIEPNVKLPAGSSRRPLRHFVLEPLRAGAVVGAGGLASLAAALGLESTIPDEGLILGGAACALGSVALAVRYGYPASRLLEPPLGRAVGAALYGGLIVIAALAILAPRFPGVNREPLALALMLFLASVLLPVGLLRRRAAGVAPEEAEARGPGVPAAPERQAPGEAYALRGDGPPVDAAEVELEAPALEVEVRWGDALIAVRHLSPPRRLVVGGAGSAPALPEELLGAAERAIAVVERGAGRTAAVSVVPPPVAVGTVEHGGKRTPLEVALREAGVGEGREQRLPLREGARVTLVLGAAGRGGYRTPAAGGEGRVAITLALVKAGRRVGRARSWSGMGPVVLASGAAALLAGAALWWSAGEQVNEGEREVARLVELERRAQALRDDCDGERDGEELEPDPPEGVLRFSMHVSTAPILIPQRQVFEREDLAAMAYHDPTLYQGWCSLYGLNLSPHGPRWDGAGDAGIIHPFLRLCAEVIEGPAALRGLEGIDGLLAPSGGSQSGRWRLGHQRGAAGLHYRIHPAPR